MRIEHIAIWVMNLEEMRKFYVTYFNAVAGEKYHNPAKEFTSYFLSFIGGARLEIMHTPSINKSNYREEHTGLIHFAMSIGSKAQVDLLTEKLREDGFTIAGEPRTTGDGYYESVVLDPEGNQIEITI
ncbi:VOC family protein [Maribacter litoralis]|uniref:VOC family protein n=1 Tax=Maribacter litoralis TaxID=2059726 RepID=UPI003F5CEB1D